MHCVAIMGFLLAGGMAFSPDVSSWGLDMNHAPLDTRNGDDETIISEYVERARELGLDQAVQDCLSVVESGRAHRETMRRAREEGRRQSDLDMSERHRRLPWGICFATMRLIGEKADVALLDDVEDLFFAFDDVAPSSLGKSMVFMLQKEAAQARYAMLYGSYGREDLVGLFRELILETADAPVPWGNHTIMVARTAGVLFQRILDEFGWGDEVLALFRDPERAVRRAVRPWANFHLAEPHIVQFRVSLLDDPDPIIRRETFWLLTIAEVPPPRTLVLALMRLITLEHVSDTAKEAAEEVLSIRGYSLMSTTDGVAAISEARNEVIELTGDSEFGQREGGVGPKVDEAREVPGEVPPK